MILEELHWTAFSKVCIQNLELDDLQLNDLNLPGKLVAMVQSLPRLQLIECILKSYGEKYCSAKP